MKRAGALFSVAGALFLFYAPALVSRVGENMILVANPNSKNSLRAASITSSFYQLAGTTSSNPAIHQPQLRQKTIFPVGQVDMPYYAAGTVAIANASECQCHIGYANNFEQWDMNRLKIIGAANSYCSNMTETVQSFFPGKDEHDLMVMAAMWSTVPIQTVLTFQYIIAVVMVLLALPTTIFPTPWFRRQHQLPLWLSGDTSPVS